MADDVDHGLVPTILDGLVKVQGVPHTAPCARARVEQAVAWSLDGVNHLLESTFGGKVVLFGYVNGLDTSA